MGASGRGAWGPAWQAKAPCRTVRGFVVLSKEAPVQGHGARCCGATGSGKTEDGAAPGVGGGEGHARPGVLSRRQGRPRGGGALRRIDGEARAGRRVCTRTQPLDGWRGEPLRACWAGRSRSSTTRRRDPRRGTGDLARVAPAPGVRQRPQGPPRSSRELLARLDLEALRTPTSRTTRPLR